MERLNYIQNEYMQSFIFNKRSSRRPYKLDCEILIKTKDLDYKELLRARKLGITGTDIAAIAGENKYKSAMAVYLEKISDEISEDTNEKAYFGKILEDVVARDEELINYLKDLAQDFWENKVLKGEAPEADGSSATTESLRQMYPDSKKVEIQLENNALELINKRDTLKEVVELIETKVKESENKLKKLLEDNEVGIIAGKKVIWKSYKRLRFDLKALKREEPEIYKRYLKETSYRKFEIKTELDN